MAKTMDTSRLPEGFIITEDENGLHITPPPYGKWKINVGFLGDEGIVTASRIE